MVVSNRKPAQAATKATQGWSSQGPMTGTPVRDDSQIPSGWACSSQSVLNLARPAQMYTVATWKRSR